MNLLVVARKTAQAELRSETAPPRIGEKVDLFYRPFPIVQDILWWPKAESIIAAAELLPVEQKKNFVNIIISAIILVD